MVDNATNDVFSNFLATWSNVANLVMVFIIAGLIPFLNWINRYVKNIKQAKRKAQDEHITEIAKAVNKPIVDQMTGILDIIQKTAEANEANAQNLEKLTHTIENLADKQGPMHLKIEYIDEFFKNYIASGAGNTQTRYNKEQKNKRQYNEGRTFKQDSNP